MHFQFLIQFSFSFISKIDTMKQNEVHWKAVSDFVAPDTDKDGYLDRDPDCSHNFCTNNCSAPGVFLLVHNHQQYHWCSSTGFYCYSCIRNCHGENQCSGTSVINQSHQQWIDRTEEVINYHIFCSQFNVLKFWYCGKKRITSNFSRKMNLKYFELRNKFIFCFEQYTDWGK